MISGIDLAMRTKNCAETLPSVLKRIDEVIPYESVNNRILIDDHSADDTREIAKSFGWQVFYNEGTGVNIGARTALKRVKTQYFASFEQDLLLARDWWIHVPTLLEKDKVAVASGVRIADIPFSLNRLQHYVNETYRAKIQKNPTFLFGRTIDNTIYKTEIIKRVGGFPDVLVQTLARHGYIWAVNFDVKSIHLQRGLLKEIKHQYWYGTFFRLHTNNDVGESSIFILHCD